MEDVFWTGKKIAVVSVLAFLALIGGVLIYPLAANAWWAATAPAISSAQEKQIVYTGQNRINQYKLFYGELETYNTDVNAVKTNQATLNDFNKEYTPAMIAADQTGDLEQTQNEDQQAVAGASQECVAAANAYNLDSDEIQTGAQFKSVTLPKSVDVSACNA